MFMLPKTLILILTLTAISTWLRECTADPIGLSVTQCSDDVKDPWFCKDGTCIRKQWVCDGGNDCPDASDETEHCVHNKCKKDEFSCRSNGNCVNKNWQCDGETDCDDYSDEWMCDTCKLEDGLYRCDNGSRCVPMRDVCDGKADCHDGTDEMKSCKILINHMSDNSSDSCEELGCEGHCHPTPLGLICTCSPGYRLTDETKCTDIDECVEFSKDEPLCSHYCTNSPGHFSCSCQQGYKLDTDSITCRANGGPAMLIYSTQTQILSRTLDDSLESYNIVADGLNNVVDLAYDSITRTLFWSDSGLDAVQSLRLGGDQHIKNFTRGLGCPEGLAVDWIGRNLYVVDTAMKQVVSCPLDGAMCAVLVETDIDQPRDIVLDPLTGKMYWSDWGEHPKIAECSMDGTNCRSMITLDVVWPNGLTIDTASHRLFWTDAWHGHKHTYRVESIKLEDSDRKDLTSIAEGFHPISVAVFEDKLYFSDIESNEILMLNKHTGKEVDRIRAGGLKLLGILVVHPILQPHRRDPCFSAHCSHLCLLNENGNHTCACPRGMQLSSNQRTCLDKEDTEYLLLAGGKELIKLYPNYLGNKPEYPVPVFVLHKVTVIDYIWAEKMCYYADVGRRVIAKLPLDSARSSEETVLIKDAGVILSLSVDWLAKNIYWVNSEKNQVEVAKTDGSLRTSLNLHAEHLGVVAVYPQKGYLFYSDVGSDHRLHRCDMAGNNCIILVDNVLVTSAIVIDASNDLLYFANNDRDSIVSITIMGNQKNIVVTHAHYPYGLAVLGDRLYWTDLNTQGLYYISTSTHRGGILHTGYNDQILMGITSISSKHQPQVGHGCVNNGGCSHLCLLQIQGKRLCSCPLDMRMLNDTTCLYITKITSKKNSQLLSNPDVKRPVPLDTSRGKKIGKNVSNLGNCEEDPCGCQGDAAAGCDNQTEVYSGYQTLKTSASSPFLAGIICFAVLVLALLLAAVYCYRKHRQCSNNEMVIFTRFRNFFNRHRLGTENLNRSTQVLVDSSAFENPMCEPYKPMDVRVDVDTVDVSKKRKIQEMQDKLTQSTSKDSVDSAFVSQRNSDEYDPCTLDANPYYKMNS